MDMFLECLINEIFAFVLAKPACFSAVTEALNAFPSAILLFIFTRRRPQRMGRKKKKAAKPWCW